MVLISCSELIEKFVLSFLFLTGFISVIYTILRISYCSGFILTIQIWILYYIIESFAWRFLYSSLYLVAVSILPWKYKWANVLVCMQKSSSFDCQIFSNCMNTINRICFEFPFYILTLFNLTMKWWDFLETSRYLKHNKFSIAHDKSRTKEMLQ